MKAVKEKKLFRVPEGGFDHKLTPDEINEILENYDYQPYDEDDDSEVMPIYDKFGNPTRDTFDAMYESRHGIGEIVTIEELQKWVDSL